MLLHVISREQNQMIRRIFRDRTRHWISKTNVRFPLLHKCSKKLHFVVWISQRQLSNEVGVNNYRPPYAFNNETWKYLTIQLTKPTTWFKIKQFKNDKYDRHKLRPTTELWALMRQVNTECGIVKPVSECSTFPLLVTVKLQHKKRSL